MNLTLGEEQMRAVVTKAILDGLGDEQKTLILTQAVEHLMGAPADSRGSYYTSEDKRNRLQRAFDGAAEQALMKVAREEMEKPENLERIRKLMGPIVEQVLSAESYNAVQRSVADAIVEAFKNQKESR